MQAMKFKEKILVKEKHCNFQYRTIVELEQNRLVKMLERQT